MSFLMVEEATKQFFNQLQLSTLPYPPQIFIGLSGGVDSVVLTHVIKSWLPNNFHLTVVYIHHGLQNEADAWGEFCEQFCLKLQIPFIQQKVVIEQTNRKGLEAVAREKRYEALVELMDEGDYLLTGHHLQDQAETLLLNLFRGSGLHGLAAMPTHKKIQQKGKHVIHFRPLLKVEKAAIYDYARQFGLDWVEDPSNQAVDFQRNRLRNEIVPSLKQHWPKLENTLSNTAQHLSESFQLLEVLAEEDTQQCVLTPFSIDLTAVRHLSWARQKNLLIFWARHYINEFRFTQDIFKWLEEALDNNNPEAHPERKLSNAMLRVEGHKVFYLADFETEFKVRFNMASLSKLHFDETALLTHTIQPNWFSAPHSAVIRSITENEMQDFPELKKWFKQNKVVFWNRKRWPVIEINGEIAAILGFKTFDSFK